ncbi:MAG: hypothetical protein E7408_05730 [Ruminococcaceae bacterium]|nr:hypothetical protein [Oscillospiraceae bacterium]
MRKEKLKTALLLVLICSSIILAANVWFGSGVWPHGYDFFVTLPNRAFFSHFFKQEQPYLSPMESLAKPRLLVITNGGSRAVYYNSDASYAPYYESVNTFFKTVLADENALVMSTIVGEEEWYDVLRNDELLDTRSIYISYSTAFSPRLFAQVIGTEHTWLEDRVATLREFILAPVDASGQDVLLYIRSSEDGSVSKFYINYPHKAALYDRISAMDENLGYSYAFELNLHDSMVGIGGGVEQKVVMDPLLLISPRSTESVAITGANPITSEADMDALLSAFDYRERGVNRYTGTDGTLHFVENYGSISIHPDGLVEYYAVDEEMGVNILPAEGGTASLYDALNGAVRFADRVWSSLVTDQPFDALVSSDLVENEQGEYTFTLDYYYEGTPITMAAEGIDHAAIIRVKNGRIVEYRHFLRRFSGTGTPSENVPMLEAIDGMYARFAMEDSQIRITDLYLSYIADNATDEMRPVWCARIAGRQALVRAD